MSAAYEDLLLVSSLSMVAASDEALACTIASLIDEQKRRALESGDLAALAQEAFETWGFTRSGTPSSPRLVGGLLICPGYKLEKSSASHDCSFVSAEGTWVWEHPEAVHDEMRTLPGAKVVRQTVTILPAYEGMTFDVVASSARSGPCRMKSAHTFSVQGGQLVETARRVRVPESHR